MPSGANRNISFVGSGISFGHGGSTDGSFGSFGEVQVTIPPARADKIFDAFAGHVPSAPQFLNAPAPIPTCRSAVCIEYGTGSNEEIWAIL